MLQAVTASKIRSMPSDEDTLMWRVGSGCWARVLSLATRSAIHAAVPGVSYREVVGTPD